MPLELVPLESLANAALQTPDLPFQPEGGTWKRAVTKFSRTEETTVRIWHIAFDILVSETTILRFESMARAISSALLNTVIEKKR